MRENLREVTPNREELAARTFVELADSLVDDFDVIDMLTVLVERCVELLGVATAGILLADRDGHLRVMAASTEQVELLELFQLQNDEGPCLDSFRAGEVVTSTRLTDDERWPRFAAECVRLGYPSVFALPLRVRERVLGCLNLFLSEPVALDEADVALARALAAVASIAMVQDEAAREAAMRQGQLQHALESRVAIEQAKGMIAERGTLTMDEAFSKLRVYARSNNRGLTDVAGAVVAKTIDIDAMVRATARPPARSGARTDRP